MASDAAHQWLGRTLPRLSSSAAPPTPANSLPLLAPLVPLSQRAHLPHQSPQHHKEPRIDPAISNLRPGQTLKAGVSLGRPDNHICDVTAGGDLTLEAARELIMAALTVRLNEDYDFINLDGKIIDVEEEDKRMLLWECGRNVLLRPKSWVVL